MQRKSHSGRCKRCDSSGPFGVDRARWHGLRDVCRECDRAAVEKRRKSDPNTREKGKEYSRAWREANREKFNALMRAWRKANREKVRQEAKERRNAKKLLDPEGYAEGLRRQYQRQKPKTPEQSRRTNLARRKRKMGAPGTASDEQIRWRIGFYGGRCAYCGAGFEHIDHVIPLSRGGSNWPANLRPACGKCNREKHNRRLQEWAASKHIRPTT